MREKLSKISSLIKKEGFFVTFKKILKVIKNKYFSKIEYIFNFKKKSMIKKSISEISEILKTSEYDSVVVWRSSFGWDVPLFQRPQHIANCLSKERVLVFYEITKLTDKVDTIKKQQENLYLVNFENPIVSQTFFKCMEQVDKPKYIQLYSTNWSISLKEIKEYIKNGYKILYEYIDDLNPALAGTEKLPKNIIEKHNYAMSDVENVYVVVTADELYTEVIKKRGNKNLAFSTNGVDYEHFQTVKENYNFNAKFKKIIEQKKPIIGYYGALASWFDYDLLKKLLESRKDYNIILFGYKYDDSFEKEEIEKYNNLHFLGTCNYNILHHYANKFDVCVIPFKINDITKATSPVKIFEYMALNKPIVTTKMHECEKYKSVMIAKDAKNFISLVDKAIEMNKNKNKHNEYFKQLKTDALNNTWGKKTKIILEMLKEN